MVIVRYIQNKYNFKEPYVYYMLLATYMYLNILIYKELERRLIMYNTTFNTNSLYHCGQL